MQLPVSFEVGLRGETTGRPSERKGRELHESADPGREMVISVPLLWLSQLCSEPGDNACPIEVSFIPVASYLPATPGLS